MDGTFSSTPSVFSQVYKIHGYYKDQVMPFVYALLPDKTYDTYLRLFTLLKKR